MDKHNHIQEDLLTVWLQLSAVLNNDRMVKSMSFNEAFVCNLLYQAKQNPQSDMLTASMLCERTQMLKSQMNKLLNELEDKQLIIRERSTSDRRKVYVYLNEEQEDLFLQQHAQIIQFVKQLSEQMGEDRIVQVTELLGEMVDAIKQVKREDK